MDSQDTTTFTTQNQQSASHASPRYYGPSGMILGRLRVMDNVEGKPEQDMTRQDQTKPVSKSGAQSSLPPATGLSLQQTAIPVLASARTSQGLATNRFTQIFDASLRPPKDDLTASHGGQDRWSLDNLPEILYMLRPECAKSRQRVRKTEYEVFGQRLNKLIVLPDRISSNVEGWRLEAWIRLDRRITTQDIIDRVNPKYRGRLSEEVIEWRRQTFRENFYVACWGAQKSVNEIHRRVVAVGIDPKLNTTRGLTPGLIDPSKGEAGGRIPIPPNAVGAGISRLPIPVPLPKPLQVVPNHQAPNVQRPVQAQAAFGNPPYRMNRPEIIYCTPSSSRAKGSTGEASRQKTVYRTVTIKESPRSRKRRIMKQAVNFDYNSYPVNVYELASHHRSPDFPTEEDNVATMSMDEFLSRSELSFSELLESDSEDNSTDSN
ncbi:hypothetical protein BDV25DRAFT_139893 [Aspergillus avenaceus]|uniref:Uncharacterized protein n=1 Tax=Aspergillus avenaceus TaxID=36643 RepID=A0A5N6TVT7_ASPAV|nr:hypothetical protein BDV25DRAFT_139893 [Aspergillus avenaceus]